MLAPDRRAGVWAIDAMWGDSPSDTVDPSLLSLPDNDDQFTISGLPTDQVWHSPPDATTQTLAFRENETSYPWQESATSPNTAGTAKGHVDADHFLHQHDQPVALVGKEQSPSQDAETVFSWPQFPSSPIGSSPCSSASTTCESSSVDVPRKELVIRHFKNDQIEKSPIKASVQKKRPPKNGGKPGQTAIRFGVILSDKKPETKILKGRTGEILGQTQIFGKHERIRSSTNPEARRKTRITREFGGVCPKCQKSKQGCARQSWYEPCDRCLAQALNNKQGMALNHHIMSCLSVNLENLFLHRKGTTGNSDLSNWMIRKEELAQANYSDLSLLPEIPQVVELTQGIELTRGVDVTLKISISRFHPQPGDTTAFEYKDAEGRTQSIELPPYYINDLAEAESQIRDYAKRARRHYLRSLLNAANPIVRATFQAACNFAEKSNLVSDALTFWAATRFTERLWKFTDDSEVEIDPISEPGFFQGTKPITPIMDSQLDELAIKLLLIPLRESILGGLMSKMREKKAENWFEIYLTMFVLMANTEMIFQDVLHFTQRFQIKPKPNRGSSLSEKYTHGCKTLLAYFHFVCNGPQRLLTSSTKKSGPNATNIEEVEYLSEVGDMLNDQRAQFESWKTSDMYADMYWCNQMLCLGWRDIDPYPQQTDGFTEEDFILS